MVSIKAFLNFPILFGSSNALTIGLEITCPTLKTPATKSKSVKKLIDEWARNISYGIFNLAATLNPQRILIIGGVSSQQDLLSTIKKQLDDLPWWNDIKIPVELCKHRNDAGMIGAMYHLIQQQR